MIILVRHPPTVLNADGRERGQLDPPLAKNGVAVIKRTAAQFKDVHVDKIFVDDTIRTRAMAAGISKVTGVPVTVTDKLRTWNLGKFAGEKTTDVEKDVREYMLNKQSTPIPGGESFEAFATNYLKFLHPFYVGDKTVVFVTHGRVVMTSKAWQKADGDKAPMDLTGGDLSPSPDILDPGGIAIFSKTQPFKVIL